MIVQPDFLDHWKTRMLIDMLDDPCAPIYVIRLWSHCQNRKTHGFPKGNPAVLKAICHAPGDPEKFEKAMISCGFIEVDGEKWVAHEWENVNASIIAAWKNGQRGGRPKKEPSQNPQKTHGIPVGSPAETDKIRVDKRRVDSIPSESHHPLADGVPADGGDLTPSGVNSRKKNNGGKWTKAKLDAARYEDFPGFCTWWKSYPRNDGKRDAFVAWLKRDLEEQAPSMLAALAKKKRCRQWQEDEGKFIPHGSTYLNSRMDEDEPETDAAQSVGGLGGRFSHG